MSPEEKARLVIDEKLYQAGWVVQDMKDFNRYASLGVAVREYRTNDGDEVDYALFVEGEPVGLIEAKAEEEGVHLSSKASEQNLRYVKSGLKGSYDKKDMRFIYEATNIIIEFTDLRDPKPRLRTIYNFHRPESLLELIKDYKYNGNKTLRGRMLDFPNLPKANFRQCQTTAITQLEQSFSNNTPRALIQMATGAGKTFTAITNTYRLLKFAKAKRVLFLVDTKNLGEQAEREYKNFQPYDSTSKLSELYNIQRIQTSNIPTETKICISTIQRVYSMLRGEIDKFVDDADEESGSVYNDSPREVTYNKTYPPEFFDVIIIDECHRSIYNLWRQVLDYFDAFLVGLTATPNKDTFAFFNQNVVSEYTHEQAVNDGVNVGAFGTFVIETKKSKQGGMIATINQKIEVRDKRTRLQKWESADEEISYDGKELDNSVVNKSQIRLILQTFKDNWQKWEYFKDRKELPKTLIFAKNDSHAADIVEIAREVFGEGNDFCKKITYTSEEDEQSLLYAYRNEYNPRIAVTVSKIATGTDVKAIEILVFMRDIRSENYYEQMLGRARRTLGKEELIKSSPSAHSCKLGYVIVDAVGVTKSEKMSRGKCGGDSQPSIPFKKLLDSVVTGDISEETFGTLATRIERLGRILTDKEREKFKSVSGDVDIQDLAVAMKKAHDTDEVEETIKRNHKDFNTLSPKAQDDIRKGIIKERCKRASMPLHRPEVRKFLMTIRSSNEQTIDPALDSLINAGFTDDVDTNKDSIRQTLKEFINKHKDEITALQIIYNQEFRHRHLTEAMIKDLYEEMKRYNASLQQDLIFSAYETERKSVLRELVDIIQIIRYEWKQIPELTPFADGVRRRYKDWMFDKNKNKGGVRGASSEPFSSEQMAWLEMIRDYIAKNASMKVEALELGVFKKNGGAAKFFRLFGNQWEIIINEMNDALVA